MPPSLMRPLDQSRRLMNLLVANRGRGYHDVQNAGEAVEIWLYDEIGFWGTTAQDFAREVVPLKASQITLHLNSPGGEAWEGQAIYHTLRQHPATVEVRVEGIAASAATTVAMAASPDRLVMARGSMMMIHEAMVIIGGNARDLRGAADWLEIVDEAIAGYYHERAGGELAAWRTAMAAESWYSARDAVDAGLADMVDGDAAPASNIFDLSAFLNTPPHLLDSSSGTEHEPTVRELERALRDAGLPAAKAKAFVANGRRALDARDVEPDEEGAARDVQALRGLVDIFRVK